MMTKLKRFIKIVHCRIGSLEIDQITTELFRLVHCRIGSLEKRLPKLWTGHRVHCRIGSLESEAMEEVLNG